MSRITIISMLAAMLAVSLGCSTQPPRVIAQKLYAQRDQAYANQDVSQVLGFVDSSFVGTDDLGKRMTFEELRSKLEQWFAEVRRMKLENNVTGCKVRGWSHGRPLRE